MPTFDAIVDAAYTGAEGARVNGVKTFARIASALNDAPSNATQPYLIVIKAGRYYEKLDITKPFITWLGEDRAKTIVTFDVASDTKRPDGTTYGTYDSGTVIVRASDFRAENLTIENGFDYPANAAKANDDPTRFANPQAVALKTDKGSDRAFFKNINLVGYQDTLFVNSGRQYFCQCAISGHVDFIFGAGQAVFDDCEIVSRDRGSTTNNGYITAASTSLDQPFGFLFIQCRLRKETPAMADASVTLGRPWHPTTNLPDGTRAADPNAVGHVAFINCWMDSHVAAKGWDSMTGKDKDGNTLTFLPADSRFYECGTTGPGAIKSDTRRLLSESQSQKYTISNVLNGWNPSK
ncbi:MAG: pectinesterase A [Chloroflexi bacterium]|nr:pectinesterase A [Chloroflexota bacterium]